MPLTNERRCYCRPIEYNQQQSMLQCLNLTNESKKHPHNLISREQNKMMLHHNDGPESNKIL